MGCGFIVSESAPDPTNKYSWYKPSTREFFELVEGAWTKVGQTDITELVDLNITGDLRANGDLGLTGSKVIQGYTLTFKKGLLVGFQAP